jgi:hypothetical protein
LAIIGIAALIVAVIATLLVWPFSARAADLNTIYLNSSAFSTDTDVTAALAAGACTPGDDGYDASTPANNRCSLRAALTYANTHSTAATPLTITLASDFLTAGAGGGFIPMNSPTISTTYLMDATYINTGISIGVPGSTGAKAPTGAAFTIDAPMTINLQHALGIKVRPGPGGTASASDPTSNKHITFLIRASGVHLLNCSDIQNGMTAITVDKTASDVEIRGGITRPIDNGYTAQFLVIQNGATNVTFADYTVGNLRTPSSPNEARTSMGCNAALCFTSGGNTQTPSDAILVDNVNFINVTASDSCTVGVDGGGCKSSAIYVAVRASIGSGNPGGGLEIKESTFGGITPTAAPGTAAYQYIYSNAYNAGDPVTHVNGLNFHDNRTTTVDDQPTNYPIAPNFTCSEPNTAACALIKLYPGSVYTGNNLIASNVFENPANTQQALAISADGGIAGDTEFHLTIEDNSFDGFTGPGIGLWSSGTLTVQRNTFGVASYSNANVIHEETAQLGHSYFGGSVTPTEWGMFVNGDPESNMKIGTWYPNNTPTVAPATCQVSFTATAPGSGDLANKSTQPRLPLRLDTFWTSDITAEIYVGSTSVPSGTTATINLPIPPSLIQADGTLLAGYLRLQTQSLAVDANNPESSQYSRTVPLTGSCTIAEVTALATDHGPAAGGNNLTITGNNFSHLDPGTVSIDLSTGGKCAPVTIVNDHELTCVMPASTRQPSRSGLINVTVSIHSAIVANWSDAYTYLIDGTLTVDKRAWINAPTGLSATDLYDAIIGGASGATELANGAAVAPGTTVTWTYTVNYAYTYPAALTPGTADIGVLNAQVTDDKIGPVCTIAQVLINQPTGCAASGVVQ